MAKMQTATTKQKGGNTLRDKKKEKGSNTIDLTPKDK